MFIIRALNKDEKLRSSLVVRAYNRRAPDTTVLQQFLSLASTRTGDGVETRKGELYLDVEKVRGALGLDRLDRFDRVGVGGGRAAAAAPP